MLLHDLLTNSASNYPEHPAVILDDEVLHYQKLETRSNQIANWLLQHEIHSGDRVGIYLPKSLLMIQAVFGILKAGAVYVPIVATTPSQRVQHLVADCDMKAIVTTDILWESLTDIRQDQQIIALTDCTDLSQYSLDVTPPNIHPHNPAYILYTSGSTGQPKGVVISHRASLNFVNWACERFQVSHDDRITNHASLQFDLSVFDIYVSIKSGATLHILSESRTIFPTSISKYVTEQKLTIWYSVPSALVQLVKYGQLHKYPMSQLRHILFAGEPFPVEPLKELMHKVPHAVYHNLYGPTETNVCTHYEVEQLNSDSVSIGFPCAGHDLYVIRDDGSFADVGESGELYVVGDSLMDGYWNLPDLSTNVLVTLLGLEGSIAYRTGDRVRMEADGTYTFQGRIDNMIKSRGYRVEPMEIEHILIKHPHVIEALVVPIPDVLIGNRLKAIIVVKKSSEVQSDLTVYCRSHLPHYMIPSEFEVRHEPLPRTDRGKIDRQVWQSSND